MVVATPPPSPTVTQTTTTTEPPVLLRVAGLVTLVASIGIDAFAPSWNPDPWVYLGAVALIVWGPNILPSLTHRKDGQ